MGNYLLRFSLIQQGFLYITKSKPDSNEGQRQCTYTLHISRQLFVKGKDLTLAEVEKMSEVLSSRQKLSLKGIRADQKEFELEILGMHNGEEDLKIDLNALKELMEVLEKGQKETQTMKIRNDLECRYIVLFGDLKFKDVLAIRPYIQREILKKIFGSAAIETYPSNQSLLEFLYDNAINERYSYSLAGFESEQSTLATSRKDIRKIELREKLSYNRIKNILQELTQQGHPVEILSIDNCTTFAKLNENNQNLDGLLSIINVKSLIIRNIENNLNCKLKKEHLCSIFDVVKRNQTTLLDLSGNNLVGLEFSQNQDDNEGQQKSQENELIEEKGKIYEEYKQVQQEDKQENKDTKWYNYQISRYIRQFFNPIQENVEQKEKEKEVEKPKELDQDNIPSSHAYPLKVLCLNSNKFTQKQILKDLFSHPELASLQRLYLISNSIKEIEMESATYKLRNLKYLNLSGNNINGTSARSLFTFTGWPQLESLILRRNAITKFLDEGDTCGLTSLKFLDLSANNFDSAQANILFRQPQITSIIELNINNNRGELHPLDLSGLTSLAVLNISTTNCHGIKSEYPLNGFNTIFSTITTAQLFSSIQQQQQQEQSSSRQQKQQLHLHCLPKSLQSLDLSDNKIRLPTQTSSTFKLISQTFYNLLYVSLANNQIIDASIFLLHMQKLVSLDLSHNLIRDVDTVNLPHIHDLNLSYNLIADASKLFDQLADSKTLNSLNLSNNQIAKISQQDQHNTRQISHSSSPLKYLDLSFNQLNCQASQEVFQSKQFSNLHTLSLAFNSISIPIASEQPNKLVKLTALSLASNRISAEGFERILLSDFPYLQELDLYKNQIGSLEQFTHYNTVSSLPRLSKVILSKNDLNANDSCILIDLFRQTQEIQLNYNEIDPLSNSQPNHDPKQIILNEVTDFSQQNPPQYPPISSDNSAENIPEEKHTHSVIFPNNSQIALKQNNLCKLNSSKSLITDFSYSNSLIDSKLSQELLSKLSNVQIVNFSENRIISLTQLSSNHHLTNLNLSNNALNSAAAQAIFSSFLPALRILSLANNQIEELLPENLTTVQLKSLEILSCQSNQISSKQCQLILSSNILPAIRVINFRFNKITEPVDSNENEIKCKNLESLILQKNNITTKGAQELFRMNSQSLTSLDLSSNQIKSQFVLPEIGLGNLKRLDINGNQLSDEGSNQIFNSISLPNLTMLNLSMNRIFKFPEIIRLQSLFQLNLSGNSIVGVYSKLDSFIQKGYFSQILL